MSNPTRFVRGSSGPRQIAPSYFYRQRKRNREAREIGIRGVLPTVEQIANVDNLLWIYGVNRQAGQAAGVDGLSYRDIGRKEAADIVRSVSKSVINGTYRPWPTRKVLIPKSNGKGTRELAIGTIFDRVVSAAINDALSKLWEGKFLPGSYGFRPNRNVWGLLARLEGIIAQQKRYVLAVDDIKNAFPSVVIDDVMSDHARYITDSKLLALIEVILRGGTDRKIGIDQGNPYSPTALNVRLHHAFDCQIALSFPLCLRYADNLAYPCQSVSEGQEFLDCCSSMLAKAGFTLKGEDGLPIDLREGEAQLLGFTLSVDDNQLRVDLGMEAWNKLSQTLLDGHQAEDPSSHARQALDGWINAFGPAFANVRDDILNRIFQIAVRLGYREIASVDNLSRQMKSSGNRWKVYLRALREVPESSLRSGMRLPRVTPPGVPITPGGG
jgi:hypothetical protein